MLYRSLLSSLLSKFSANAKFRNKPDSVEWANLFQLITVIEQFILYRPDRNSPCFTRVQLGNQGKRVWGERELSRVKERTDRNSPCFTRLQIGSNQDERRECLCEKDKIHRVSHVCKLGVTKVRGERELCEKVERNSPCFTRVQ